MDPLNLLYRLAADLLGPPVVLGLTLKGRFGGPWAERLGFLSLPPTPPRHPRFLFHAASVGEAHSAVKVIRALLKASAEKGLLPEIYLSVGTPAGRAEAMRLLRSEGRAWVLAAPLDFWGAPGRFLDALKPSALVIMETELWPNLIESAHSRGIKLMLAAARLSGRSFRRYKKTGRFISSLLARFDHISAMGEHERGLYAALGAPEEKLGLSGNPKFDGLLEETESPDFQARTKGWAERIKGEGGPLIVLGSSHPGEEEAMVRAFESIRGRHPSASLLLAPRHLTRVDDVLNFLRGRELSATLTREAEAGPASGGRVFLANEMGHLLSFYALADVAVVGGSLLPGLAGHNPLEAAAAGVPMLFGPNMSSFAREAEGLLAAGGARETSPERLAGDIEFWLENPDEAKKTAQAAYDYLAGCGQAAPALAEAILQLAAP